MKCNKKIKPEEKIPWKIRNKKQNRNCYEQQTKYNKHQMAVKSDEDDLLY